MNAIDPLYSRCLWENKLSGAIPLSISCLANLESLLVFHFLLFLILFLFSFMNSFLFLHLILGFYGYFKYIFFFILFAFFSKRNKKKAFFVLKLKFQIFVAKKGIFNLYFTIKLALQILDLSFQFNSSILPVPLNFTDFLFHYIFL